MKNKIAYIGGLIIALVMSGCTKLTIIEETVTEVGQGPVVFDYSGIWKAQTPDNNRRAVYYVFDKSSNYCQRLEEDQYGYKRADYYTTLVTPTHFRVANYGNRRYTVSGDTLTFLGGWDGVNDRDDFVKVTDGSIDPATWVPELTVTRTTVIPRGNGNSPNTNNSFGIDGDFLYINARPTGTYRFYKLNTLNGMFVDSADAPINTWHALYYKGSSNKLYHTRNSSPTTMKQRTGLNGADANLSTNSINVQAISVNGTSGTVYAGYNNQIYSGSEGGNFSSLYTFSGNYPRCNVYYKSDQFLGVRSGNLILFEISPTFKIVGQYKLPGGQNIRNSISTNGSDIWVMTYNNQTNWYDYKKVSLN